MKIALFSETFPPNINGVATHVKILRDGLIQLGHEVLVVCADPKVKKHVLKNNVLYCASRELKKIYGFGFANPLSVSLRRYLHEFSPDIIHIHTEFGVGFAGARFAVDNKIPLIYTMHTMYDEYMHYVVPKKLIAPAKVFAHKYAKYLGKKSSALIGPSKKVEEYFRMCGITKEVNVMSNIAELDLFEPENIDADATARVREKYGLDGYFTACFCGRLGQEKSVDVLLKYWAEMAAGDNKTKLMIIGGGPCEAELKELAVKLNIADLAIFTGRVEHKDLPPYYAACDMYITASMTEMNSVSMKEAMAAGLPALYIADDLNIGQIEHGKNGFIYRNAAEMKQYLNQYRDMSDEEQESMRRYTQESAVQGGIAEWARNIANIYQRYL